MVRFILFSAFFLILYYVIKGFLKSLKSRKVLKTGSKQAGKQPPIIDVLVQDPVCGVYCPKKDALTLNWQGKTYYFCSDKCRNEFRDQKK
ncbi:MAG: YHS domain-containing protein [Deltaproteobacteria bacterium]|nr:YHS domain-containing protein [Deltaproteobacteria bacterium]MBW1965723.1 YHS domain-containing protein [Deltaproteobacteria bacterium]MBW2081082.1 YHS domain-containing protein [Deltaproteobacteria bacterium]